MTLIKKGILFFCFVCFTTLIHSQNNRQIDTSYSDWSEEHDGIDYFKYKLDSLGITYSYNSSNQTHNYSGNFDFDGDLLNDSLYLVGNGGAHILYSPVIRLSTTNKQYTFNNIIIDDPEFYPISELNKLSFLEFFPPQFVIGTYNQLLENGEMQFSIEKNRHVLFLHLDKNYYPKELTKQGVTSSNIVIYFSEDGFQIQDFR